MEIEFDLKKSAKNAVERGLPFDLVADFDFETALVAPDAREAYGEDRFIAAGHIGERLYVVAYTMRDATLRVISFRKANAREVERYEQAQS
jgi:uncharacterized DUF497 family protein